MLYKTVSKFQYNCHCLIFLCFPLKMQLSLDQMDLEVVTQRFASGDRLWDISRTNPDGKEQESEYDMHAFKGELRPEISLLHMKVLTLIKAKSNVFL